MNYAKFSVVDGKVELNKQMNEIDLFVKDVVGIIVEFADYVIVSGYVAILFGRSRGSEYVDMFIKEMPFAKFEMMYKNFVEHSFEWNIENPKLLYEDYLTQGVPVGVWRKNCPLLRMDMKFPKEQSQKGLFEDRINVLMDGISIWLASIESTIAYKEQIAKSDKDILDARHLRKVFDGLDEKKIETYKKTFSLEFNNAR